MKKICLTLVFSFLCGTYLLAQQFQVKGIVLDSVTRHPIAYATVRCPELIKTSAANAVGEFEITVDRTNQIVISCVGYKSKSFTAESGDLITLYLTPSVTEISEVIVFASKPSDQAKKIVKKAFDHLSKRAGAFATIVDLRHTIKQNDTYVKMLDAQIFFQDEKKYNGKSRPEFVQERITYLQKRESLDFATDRVNFQRSYFDFYDNDFAFLLKNGLKYAITSHEYEFYIERVDELRNEIRYEISAFDKTTISKGYSEIFDITYEIYVNKSTQEHFIKSYELNYKSSASRKFLKHTENSFFKIQLQKNGENFVPEYIEHFLLQTTQYDSLSKPSQVEAFHHLTFSSAAPAKSKPIKNIQYMPDYWAAMPLDPKLRKDLSSQMDIEKQFSSQHILAEKMANQEMISKTIIDNYIQENKQHNVYLVLWDKPEAILSFLNSPDVIDQRKCKLVFIGALESNKSWIWISGGTSTMFYPQFNLPSLIRAFLPKGTNPPCYVLIKKSGDKIHKEKPLDLSEFE